jgi:hypothetical protein
MHTFRRMKSKLFPFIIVKYSTSGFDVTEYNINIDIERALKVSDKRVLI